MSEVSAWLHRLGLGKYTKAFEDNEIEFDFLPHVTEHMLEQIGVPVYNIPGASPLSICRGAREEAARTGRDVIVYDTAGRR